MYTQVRMQMLGLQRSIRLWVEPGKQFLPKRQRRKSNGLLVWLQSKGNEIEEWQASSELCSKG
jgi:hypothetical protein